MNTVKFDVEPKSESQANMTSEDLINKLNEKKKQMLMEKY